MIRQINHEDQTENRSSAVDEGVILNNTNNPTQVNGSQVDMHTLEKNIVNEVDSEVESVMKTFETRVQDAVLTEVENLVIPRVELAMKSGNAASGISVKSNILNPDQGVSGNVEGLQMTASGRMNSHTDLSRIDETRGNITVEGGDLTVKKRNFDRQTHTHYTGKPSKRNENSSRIGNKQHYKSVARKITCDGRR